MTGPHIGSFCTGYGGLDMAVQAVFGGELAWWSDVEPGPIAVMGRHHPGVPNVHDVKTAAPLYPLLPRVDILTAGYPCQPFSNAGKRLGTQDPRHLWPFIAQAVGALRPGLVVLENVAAHLRRGFDVVLQDLAALGYDATWAVVRASDVGAPHRRERLFVVAQDTDVAAGQQWRAAAPGQTESGRARPDARGRDNVSAADTLSEPLRQQSGRRSGPSRAGTPEPGHLGEASADYECANCSSRRGFLRIRASDPVEPSTFTHWIECDYCGQYTAASDTGGERRNGRAHGLGIGREAAERRQARSNAGDSTVSWGDYQPAVERWESITGRAAPEPTEIGARGARVLSPRFVEWMQGLPAGHVTDTEGLSRNAQLKLLGNGVVPQQAEHALRLLLGVIEQVSEAAA